MFKNHIFLILLIFAQAHEIDPVKGRNDKASAKISGLALTDVSIPEAFTKILYHLNLPGGIIRVFGCEPDINYSFNVNGLNVEEALNYITSYNKKYMWIRQDGVINLIASGPGPGLLAVHVDKLVVTEPHLLAGAVSGRLLANPKVRMRAEELKIREGTYDIEFLDDPDRPYIQIELHDVSVREGLNRIALKHGAAIWQYTESRCQQENEYWLDWVIQ